MRPALPSPNENRYAVIASTAYTSRKSSFSPPGTVPACHVSPPSVVRTNVPPVPLAQITLALTTLNPCKLAPVFDFWAFHCPKAGAAIRQVIQKNPKLLTAQQSNVKTIRRLFIRVSQACCLQTHS